MSETATTPWIDVQREVNASLYWQGVVANPEFWADAPFLAVDLDPPWFHCKPCIDAGTSTSKARLSVGARFCSECGSEIEWPEQDA